MYSDFIDDIEHSNDPIPTAHGKHVSLVAKVHSETSSTQVSDLRTWFEESIAIKDLDFIASTSTPNDQVTCGLLELGSIDLTRLR